MYAAYCFNNPESSVLEDRSCRKAIIFKFDFNDLCELTSFF